MTGAYLKPSEFLVGPLVDAKPLTLVLPRTAYEHRALVFDHDAKRFGLLLSGNDDQLHHVSECSGSYEWNGLLVPGVDIEVDAESLHDSDQTYSPQGAIIRHGTVLAVQSNYVGDRYAQMGGPFSLLTGLSECAPRQRACFTRWRIVLGDGEGKRILHQVDVTVP